MKLFSLFSTLFLSALSCLIVGQAYELKNLSNTKYFEAAEKNKIVLLKNGERISDFTLKMKNYGDVKKEGEVVSIKGKLGVIIPALCDKMKLGAYINGELVTYLMRDVLFIDKPIVYMQENNMLSLNKFLRQDSIKVYDPNSPESPPYQFEIVKYKILITTEKKSATGEIDLIEIKVNGSQITAEIKHFLRNSSKDDKMHISISADVKSRYTDTIIPIGFTKYIVFN